MLASLFNTILEFYCRHDAEGVATLRAHSPVAEARQVQSPQGINSGLNSAMMSDQLKKSDLFKEPTEQEKEADREFELQMLKRRRRKMLDGNVPSVTKAGGTRKRSIQESEDSFEEMEKLAEVRSEGAKARKRFEKKVKNWRWSKGGFEGCGKCGKQGIEKHR